jgi:hypothetical protein
MAQVSPLVRKPFLHLQESTCEEAQTAKEPIRDLRTGYLALLDRTWINSDERGFYVKIRHKMFFSAFSALVRVPFFLLSGR